MKSPHSSVPTWVLVLSLAALFFWVMSPFLLPILLAGFVSATFENSFTRLARSGKSYRGLWATGLILALYVVIALPMIFGIMRLVSEINDRLQPQDGQASPALTNLSALKNTIDQKASELVSSMGFALPDNFQNITQQALQKVLAFAGHATSAFLIEIPSLLLSFLVFTAALFFLLTEGPRLKKYLENTDIFDPEDLNYLLKVSKSSCRSILISTIVIGGIQASIVSVAALFLHQTEFLLIFVITFICSLIPIIGAAPVALVFAASSFFAGATGEGIAWLVVATIAGTIDNILKPFIIRTDEELHPLLTLLSILGGVALWGFGGLFAGPLIATLAVAGLPKLVQHAKKIQNESSHTRSKGN